MLSKGMLIGLVIAAGLVVIVGAGIFFFLNTPEASQQLPAGSGVVQVIIQSPDNNETALIKSPVIINAGAYSELAIRELQLSINGIDLPKKFYPDVVKENRILSSWSWTPTEEGQFTLLARASTDSGITGLSNAVQLKVTSAVLDVPETQAPSGPTPDSVKARLNEVNMMLGKMTPVEEPQSSLAMETNRITFANQPAPVDTSEGSVENSVSPKHLLLLQGITAKFNPMPQPEAPVIKGSPGHCSTVLRITDQSETEAGFFLYRLDPDTQVFNRVATLNGHPGTSNFTYTDQDLPSGKYGYYLSAFNAAGETQGSPVFVESTGTDCRKPLVRSLEFASLTINPGKPVDRMYCYLSTDGSRWNRIPAGRETFVYPGKGTFDFAPYLPNTIPAGNWPADVAIGMDCWGWKGEDLEYLGRDGKLLPGWSTRDVIEFDLIEPGNMPDLKEIFPDETTKDLHSGILAPYNFHIGNASCAFNLQTKKETCTEVTQTTKKRVLFWDWDQYPFGCPESDPKCDFYPAQSFRIYYVMSLDKAAGFDTPTLMVSIDDPEQKFFDGLPIDSVKLDYYGWPILTVRAFNSYKGESVDSNEVTWNKYRIQTIKPDYIETYIKSKEYDPLGQLVQTNWFGFLGDQLLVGYFNECDPKYASVCHQLQENLFIEFTLPNDIFDEIHSADVIWSTVSTASYGVGAAMEPKYCNWHVSTAFDGPSLWQFYAQYDNQNILGATIPASEINNALSSGNRKIGFWIVGPTVPDAKPGAMDFCEIGVGDAYLRIYGRYSQYP